MSISVFTPVSVSRLEVHSVVPLEKDEKHHLTVRRVTEKETVSILDGSGGVGRGVFSKGELILTAIDTARAERPLDLCLFVAPLRIQNWEWLLEKTAELGVAVIQPVQTQFSEKTHERQLQSKTDRFRKIFIEGIKQSRQPYLPELRPLSSMEACVQNEKDAQTRTHFVAAEPSARRPSLRANLNALSHVGLWIGPEGGWHADEIDMISTLEAQIMTFPYSTLRSETAALFFASNLLYSCK